MNKSSLLIFPLVLVVLLSYAITYQFGKHVSYVKVHAEWQKEKEDTEEEIQRIKNEFRTYETAYREEVQTLSTNLQNAKDEHNALLANLRREHADRLLSSEKRANIYKRMSEDGASERRDLADHAARLDSSLEEGRALVRELWSTLRQREVELATLGAQIQADRNYLNKADKTNE